MYITESNFKSWDSSQTERFHLQICKRHLEVSNKASNAACGAELGNSSYYIAINQNKIDYTFHLQS